MGSIIAHAAVLLIHMDMNVVTNIRLKLIRRWLHPIVSIVIIAMRWCSCECSMAIAMITLPSSMVVVSFQYSCVTSLVDWSENKPSELVHHKNVTASQP